MSGERPSRADVRWPTRVFGSPVHLMSTVMVLGVLAAYLGNWLVLSWPMLTDPDLQNDDARTVLFPFHRYDDGALADDPIASEMLSMVPIGVRALYMVFVPLSDVFVAAKLVQALALLVVLWAGILLARSRRGGIAAAAVLLFFFFHDWYAINRVAGGLPRAFGFPAFALWLAAVLGGYRKTRFGAAVLAALTYPSVMNMILAAEGLFALRSLGSARLGVTLRRLKRYGVMVALCLVAVSPALVGGSDRGDIHTLEEAEQEPAFGKRGRLWILPFAKPTHALSDAFVDQFRPRGGAPIEALKVAAEQDEFMYAVLIVALFLFFPLARLGPKPQVAVAWIVGAIVLYWMSRVLAFRLYSPERYYSFGMRMGAIALVTACSAQLFHWLRPPRRLSLRNWTVAALLLVVWSFTGNGVVHDNGMTINRGQDRALHDYVRSMPPDVRFASHILDGDGIPFWSARATMGGFETLQPWFKDSWARQKDRAQQTLSALYASDPERVIDYAERNGVTHFLINRHRYGARLQRNAGSFEPFSNFARHLLQGKKASDMVFGDVPRSAIEFRQGRWLVVSVDELRRAVAEGRWGKASRKEEL